MKISGCIFQGRVSLQISTIVINKLALIVAIPQGFERIFIGISVVVANERF